MPRSAREQKAHDAAVRRWAESLERQGYEVVADVKGYHRPGTFYGLRPDIVAMNGRKRIIGEVETPKSVREPRAQAQRWAFKRMEGMSNNTDFRRRIARP
jgi:hypothetical protein